VGREPRHAVASERDHHRVRVVIADTAIHATTGFADRGNHVGSPGALPVLPKSQSKNTG